MPEVQGLAWQDAQMLGFGIKFSTSHYVSGAYSWLHMYLGVVSCEQEATQFTAGIQPTCIGQKQVGIRDLSAWHWAACHIFTLKCNMNQPQRCSTFGECSSVPKGGQPEQKGPSRANSAYMMPQRATAAFLVQQVAGFIKILEAVELASSGFPFNVELLYG